MTTGVNYGGGIYGGKSWIFPVCDPHAVILSHRVEQVGEDPVSMPNISKTLIPDRGPVTAGQTDAQWPARLLPSQRPAPAGTWSTLAAEAT